MEKMSVEKWQTLSQDEKSMFFAEWYKLPLWRKHQLQQVDNLNPQLVGLEGWRVEIVDFNDEKRRFIVGKSTGWMPCHLEISRRNSRGGVGADRAYKSVKKLYFAH